MSKISALALACSKEEKGDRQLTPGNLMTMHLLDSVRKNIVWLTKDCWYSIVGNRFTIVDNSTGGHCRFDLRKLDFKIEGTDLSVGSYKSGKWCKLFDGIELYSGKLRKVVSGHTTQGSKNYHVIQHDYDLFGNGVMYRIKLKVHWLVMASVAGDLILDAVGVYGRFFDVNHLDEDIDNNALSNLELITKAENLAYSRMKKKERLALQALVASAA